MNMVFASKKTENLEIFFEVSKSRCFYLCVMRLSYVEIKHCLIAENGL